MGIVWRIIHTNPYERTPMTRDSTSAINKDGVNKMNVYQLISFFDDLIALSSKHKLPIMVLDNKLLEKGGVLGYSPSFYSIGRQSANMAAKILRGTHPGRLSVQNPTHTQLVTSMKEVKRLGLTLPESFLVNSDEIIR